MNTISEISNNSQQVDTYVAQKAGSENWFIKAFVIKKEEDSNFYDKNIEHIKFFVKHIKSNIAEQERIVVNPETTHVQNEITKLVELANQKKEKFPYTHIMLIFSVHGTIEKFQCKDDYYVHFNEILNKLNKSNILKKMLKVAIIDVFGGNPSEDSKKIRQRAVKASADPSSGHEGILPNGMNFLCYYGFFRRYEKDLFSKGSIFLRVVFKTLLAQSSDLNAIQLDHLFQACNKPLKDNSGENKVKREVVGSLCSMISDPLMLLSRADPIEIEKQFKMN